MKLSQQPPPIEASKAHRDNNVGSALAKRARKPNLVVIGAMKASTTTFYELITRHPEIWFSSEKEPHYFTSPEYGSPTAWQSYLELFKDAPRTAKYLGEASTGYAKLPHFGNTPERLRQDLGDLRLIYLVRDPVARAISNYHHSYLSGHYESGTTLGEAIDRDSILVDASCYSRQIKAYRETFGADALLILTTDELHAQPTQVMRRVEEFLEVSAFEGWDTPLPQSNSKQALGRSLALQGFMPKPFIEAARRIMPASLREKLKAVASSKVEIPEVTDADRKLVLDRVSEDLRELRAIMGDEIDAWPSVQQLSVR